jgi:hypothetical protein
VSTLSIGDPIQTGWIYGLSLEAYLAIPAMSASGIEAFRRSPAHFLEERLHPKEPTEAMREGSALHLAILEPELYEGRYIAVGQCEAITGKGTQCTNQGSVYRDGQSFCGVRGHDPLAGEPMAAGLCVMAAEALDRIEGMKRAVLAHPQAAQYFRGKGQSEVTGVWRDEASGVLCKIRLDRMVERASVHMDLKRVADASKDAFRRQVGRMVYARLSQFYRRGMAALGKPAIGSSLIAVEANRPHGCQAFLLNEEQLAAFDPEINRLLGFYRECLETGDFPGYDTMYQPLDLLPWDAPQLVDEWDDAASEAA